MPTFFHGWRRKIGVMTLVMACVLAGGWVRSYWRVDTIGFGINHRQQWIASRNGNLIWLSQPDNLGASWGFLLGSHSAEVSYLLRLREDRIFTGRSDIFHLRSIPYWPIVGPLTLISAYLLLSKPRNPKSGPTHV